MKKYHILLLIILTAVLLNGCDITATVIFTNYDADTYTLYFDGEIVGTVTAFGRCTVNNVTLGAHMLAADGTDTDIDGADSDIDDDIYVNLMNVTFGENNWSFNQTTPGS